MGVLFEDRQMLSAYSSARAAEVAGAENVVGRSLTKHRVVAVDGDLNLVYNMASIRHVGLHYIDYGAAITIHIHQSYEPYYLVQIPLAGSMRLTTGSQELEANVGTAVITEPGRATTVLDYSQHCARLLVKVPAVFLRQRQAETRVPTIAGQVFLDPLLDLQEGPGRTWMEFLRTAVDDLESGKGLLARPHSDVFFERMIVDSLLLTRSSSSPVRRELTSALRRAMVFMDEHIAEQVTVEDVAAATYLSVRALQERFRRELGLSPMAYLRDLRLDAIHQALQEGTAEAVGVIAARYGVTHLGRFASAYKVRFGEAPSETARGSASARLAAGLRSSSA